MRNPVEPAVARIAACKLLLERGWGKVPLTFQGDAPVNLQLIERVIVDVGGNKRLESGNAVQEGLCPPKLINGTAEVVDVTDTDGSSV
jgi:hypothetical protein